MPYCRDNIQGRNIMNMNGWHFLTILIIALCAVGAVDGPWLREQLEFVISQIPNIRE